jgi:hypothetical protein
VKKDESEYSLMLVHNSTDTGYYSGAIFELSRTPVSKRREYEIGVPLSFSEGSNVYQAQITNSDSDAWSKVPVGYKRIQ